MLMVKHLAEDMLGRHISMEETFDIKTVFNFVAKDIQSSDKLLQIDMHSLRKCYDLGEFERIAWFPGSHITAEPPTKPLLS